MVLFYTHTKFKKNRRDRGGFDLLNAHAIRKMAVASYENDVSMFSFSKICLNVEFAKLDHN